MTPKDKSQHDGNQRTASCLGEGSAYLLVDVQFAEDLSRIEQVGVLDNPADKWSA